MFIDIAQPSMVDGISAQKDTGQNGINIGNGVNIIFFQKRFMPHGNKGPNDCGYYKNDRGISGMKAGHYIL